MRQPILLVAVLIGCGGSSANNSDANVSAGGAAGNIPAGSGGSAGGSTGGAAGSAAGSGGGATGGAGGTSTAASGVITEYAIPQKCSPKRILNGPDGALWFNCTTALIGRVTTSGSFTMFPVATGSIDIAFGPDGNVWYTYSGAGDTGGIGCMTKAGNVIHSYPVMNSGGSPNLIAVTPDGTIWYTGNTGEDLPEGRVVGRMTPDGNYNEIPVTTTAVPVVTRGDAPTAILAGPGGDVYVTGNFFLSGAAGLVSVDGQPPPYIAIFSPSGTLKITGYGQTPSSMITTPDGAMWAVIGTNVEVLAFTNGVLDENALPAAITQVGFIDSSTSNGDTATSIAAGPSNTFWFTEFAFSPTNVSIAIGGNIAKLKPSDGTFTHFPLSSEVNRIPESIVMGPDSKMWFTIQSINNTDAIANITP